MDTTVETPKRVIYIANRSGDITEVVVEKETPKQLRLDYRNFKNIRGGVYYVPSIVPKGSRKYNVFDDVRSAQEFVLADMRADLEGAQKRIERLTKEIAELEGILAQEA